MNGALVSFFINLFLRGLDFFAKKRQMDKEEQEAYLGYLAIMDKKTHDKVKMRLESEEALSTLQKRIRKRKQGGK